MIKERVLALALLAAVSAVSSFAKPRAIRGVVTDEASFLIPNALIELTCLQQKEKATIVTTKSDTDGRFQLEAPIRGTCKVRITAAGFSTLTVSVSDSHTTGSIELGRIRLQVSCSGPGVTCDEVTPTKDPYQTDHMGWWPGRLNR